MSTRRAVQVVSFKQPSAEELDHDFLWRCRGAARARPHRHLQPLPLRGGRRVRVHPELLERAAAARRRRATHFWQERYEDINAFERHLDRNGTKIVKFFLHVSKAEQKSDSLTGWTSPARSGSSRRRRRASGRAGTTTASRRNPYERRFRSYSHGLAPVNAPNNALIISSNTPGKVADDTKGEHSVLVTELLNELNAHVSAEGVFNKTRVAVFRASNGAQMPSVSSSLLEDVHFSPSNDPDLTTSSLAPIITENAPLVAQK